MLYSIFLFLILLFSINSKNNPESVELRLDTKNEKTTLLLSETHFYHFKAKKGFYHTIKVSIKDYIWVKLSLNVNADKTYSDNCNTYRHFRWLDEDNNIGRIYTPLVKKDNETWNVCVSALCASLLGCFDKDINYQIWITSVSGFRRKSSIIIVICGVCLSIIFCVLCCFAIEFFRRKKKKY